MPQQGHRRFSEVTTSLPKTTACFVPSCTAHWFSSSVHCCTQVLLRTPFFNISSLVVHQWGAADWCKWKSNYRRILLQDTAHYTVHGAPRQSPVELPHCRSSLWLFFYNIDDTVVLHSAIHKVHSCTLHKVHSCTLHEVHSCTHHNFLLFTSPKIAESSKNLYRTVPTVLYMEHQDSPLWNSPTAG